MGWIQLTHLHTYCLWPLSLLQWLLRWVAAENIYYLTLYRKKEMSTGQIALDNGTDIMWIEVFTTGTFSGFYIIIVWDSLDWSQDFPWSVPLSYSPNTVVQSHPGLHSLHTLHMLTPKYWVLRIRDMTSIKIWILPVKHLLSSRSSIPRKHSACNRLGVTYTYTLQVVEMNGAELKYTGENCGNKGTWCFHSGITCKSNSVVFVPIKSYRRKSLISPFKVYLSAYSKFKAHRKINLQ